MKQEAKLDKKFGMPIVDATEPLTIVINRSDLDKGKVRDGEHCAIARACIRQFGAAHVSIGKDVARVELPDGKGGRYMVRYGIPKEVKEIIKANDLGQGSATDEVVIKLIPKPPSQRLDAERKAMRKRNQRVKTDPDYKPQTRRKRGEGSYEQRMVRDLRGQM